MSTREQPDYSKKWIILLTVVTGTFMSLLSATSINVALPVIEAEFNASLAGIQWVVTGYLIIISSILPIFGWAGDMTQRKYVIASGFAIFGLAAFLCALSSSLYTLIAARLFQGLGASMVMANSFAAITNAFPPTQRGRAFGIQSSAVALGGISGPAVGGFLLELFTWRSIFYAVIPFAIAACLMSLANIPRQETQKSHHFDFPGSAMLVVTISSLILALSQGGRPGWSSSEIFFLLATAAILSIAFYKWETSISSPLVDLSMFKNKIFLNGNLAGMCVFFALSSNTMLLPFYLHRVLDAPPRVMGMVMVVFPLLVIATAPLSGYLSERYGAPRFAVTGTALMAVALSLLAFTAHMANLWPIVTAMAIFGTGNGMFQSPNNSTTLAVIPAEKHGMAGSIVALMRNFGSVVGTAIAVRTCDMVSEFHYTGHTANMTASHAFVKGYQAALLLGAVFALLALVFSLNKKKSLALAQKKE